VLFGILALVPFIDRNPARHPARRKIAITVGGVVLVTYLTLTFLMLVLPAKSHLGM
jgi:ubiquinol-cytochrome c reductase cytochrome b subunit